MKSNALKLPAVILLLAVFLVVIATCSNNVALEQRVSDLETKTAPRPDPTIGVVAIVTKVIPSGDGVRVHWSIEGSEQIRWWPFDAPCLEEVKIGLPLPDSCRGVN